MDSMPSSTSYSSSATAFVSARDNQASSSSSSSLPWPVRRLSLGGNSNGGLTAAEVDDECNSSSNSSSVDGGLATYSYFMQQGNGGPLEMMSPLSSASHVSYMSPMERKRLRRTTTPGIYRNSERDHELIIVVNIDAYRSGKIPVCQRDVPRSLASNFCKRHGLSEDQELELTKHIQIEMAKHGIEMGVSDVHLSRHGDRHRSQETGSQARDASIVTSSQTSSFVNTHSREHFSSWQAVFSHYTSDWKHDF